LSSRRFLLVVGAHALPPQIAVGAEFADPGVDRARAPAATASQNGEVIELTSDQWQFLRGIYAMNPEAPPGLPHGDKAKMRSPRKERATATCVRTQAGPTRITALRKPAIVLGAGAEYAVARRKCELHAVGEADDHDQRHHYVQKYVETP
jgi:hypothetical protein